MGGVGYVEVDVFWGIHQVCFGSHVLVEEIAFEVLNAVEGHPGKQDFFGQELN